MRAYAALVLGLLDLASGETGSIVRREREAVPLRDPLGRALTRHRFSLHGIPVRGAVELEARGLRGAQSVLSTWPTAAPAVKPEAARIPALAVRSWIRSELALPAEPQLEHTPMLVYVIVLGEPVLAWEAQLALVLEPEPTRKRVWISAMSGRLLDEVEPVVSARARVFAENPSRTPDPIEVTLPGIHADGPGAVLEGEAVRAFNCVSDEPPTVEVWRDADQCYPAHSARSNAAGDFEVALPDVRVPADSRAADDPYAELSMYYHAARFMQAMASHGIEQYACVPATMVANVRTLAPDERLGFVPFDNAYYTDQCDPGRGATMMFGQGSDVDFGYDGDVIYHELGHGMVSLLTPEGLNARRLRPEGLVADASAMNEAFADYFAFMLTDDPEVGEYVGRFWPAYGDPYIRTGENQKRCPDDLTGEVHDDGEPFGGALWTARRQLGAIMDEIVLSALTRLVRDATFEDGAAAVLAAADEWREADRISADAFAVIDRALRSRGLTDCPRVLEADPDRRYAMILRRRTSAVQPYFPGPFQLRVRVPEGGAALRVAYRLPDDAPHGVHVLAKLGEAPITFGRTLVAVDDPGDASGTIGRIREVTDVSGDWELVLRAEPLGGDTYEATLTGLAPGQVVHLAFATEAGVDQPLEEIHVWTPGAVPDGDGESSSSSDGDGEGGARSEAVYGDGAVAGECGCRTDERRPGAVLVLLAMIVPAFRRRACRSREAS